ncbi:MAG: universal stress protein [Bdellovibrio sp.]|nr:universal stress protein [Bdellovibrio sp.]
MKNRPHLLVMGSHGRSSFKKLSLGSNADFLLSKSDCNILVVRPQQ